MKILQKSIFKTLAYADIFDYPLTSSEVTNYLISDTEVAGGAIRKTLKILTDCERIFADKEFYSLRGKEKIIKIRKERMGWAKKKWKIARRTADKLKVIPTIKMIGVTGALAMDNCKENDDIDLFIITVQDSLWLTRLLVLSVSFLLGIKRRKPEDKNVKDKICFNLFLEEDHLKIEQENLFLAHEICQVKPIYDKGGIYERFMGENEWVRNFLPNAIEKSKIKNQKSKPNLKTQNFISIIIRCFNEFFYKLQFWYMKPKMTIEKVSLHQAFFHPKDLKDKIQKEFKKNVSIHSGKVKGKLITAWNKATWSDKLTSGQCTCISQMSNSERLQ